MKCKNKSKLLQLSVLEVIMICVVFVLVTVTSGLAQPHKSYRHHQSHRNVWGDPYKQYSYQFMPSLPFSGGAGLIGGGRIVEAVKAHPLHYTSMIGGGSPHPAAAPPPFLSTAASQPHSSYYSGYYYGGDKRAKGRQPPYVSSSMFSPVYQTLNPTTVTTVSSSSPPSTYHSFGRPSSPPPPAYHNHHQAPSRFPPGPIARPSMDTYREALDLFSEVVHKLERETGPGFGAFSSPNYLHSSLSNGIYGSSSPGYPPQQHLDHIMGPDFLQRAHKLYNKIIKEQNHNRGPPPGYYSSSASRGHPMNGLSYLESAMHPGSSSTRTTTYSYSGSSPYARNDIVTPETPLQRSLIDTVKAMEVNVQNDRQEEEQEDLMDTSESRMVPQQISYPPPSSDHLFRNQMIESTPAALPPPSPSPYHEEPSTTPYLSGGPTTSPFPRHDIPLNENDFIEHPLPYNEYEELIKEIAANY